MGEEDRLDKIVFAFAEYATAVEAATIAFRMNVKDLGQPKLSYSLNRLNWEETEGPSGFYESTTREANKEVSDYDGLLEDLKEHDGKMTQGGFFIWRFQRGDRIGRKKSKY